MGTAKNRARKKDESVVNVGQRLTIENERDKEDSKFQNINPDSRSHPKLITTLLWHFHLMQ